MSSVPKRRIQVASFSMSDIAGSHLAIMVVGGLLIAGSAVLAVASNSNARAAADARGAARLLTMSSAQVLQGAQTYAGGGSEKLAAAVASSSQVTSAFSEVATSADSILVLPALKGPAGDAYTAWSKLSLALNQLSLPAGLSTELSDALGREATNFASLSRKLETAGRASSASAKAHDSAARLQTYSEAGFGPASVARVAFDLQMLATELGATEFRGDVGFIEPLLSQSQAAAGKKLTKDQLTAAFQAAKVSKASAEGLASAASQSQAAFFLGLGALVLALLGLVAVAAGLRRALSELSTRYSRSVQQFRGNEAAREQLASGLRAAAQGDLTSVVTVTEASAEVSEIASLVNDVLELVRVQMTAAAESIAAGVASGDHVLHAVDSARQASELVAHELQGSAASLHACAGRSDTIALDTRAIVMAADDAVSRSTDATRVAQDAASRLESMREGLQDTSKRIKRLGERSQEINSVVEAMELLSEQIGVLALNASLEAERAGDAGAGFRLVAREVQALARRSEDTLQSISGLVQGVQADARAAAESVERSTGQVVAGANVGSLSHALLGVLAPLAESIGAMARTVAEGACANAAALTDAATASESVKRAAASAVGKVEELRTPLETGRARLNAGLNALAATQRDEYAV